MALADDIEAEARRPNRRSCGVKSLLPELPPDDRDAITEALDNSRLPATAIQRALANNGFEIGIATLQRHRRGACACGALHS